MKYFSAKYCALYLLATALLIATGLMYNSVIKHHDFWADVIFASVFVFPLLFLAGFYLLIAQAQKQGNRNLNATNTVSSIACYVLFITSTYFVPTPERDEESLIVCVIWFWIITLVLAQILPLVYLLVFKRKEREPIPSK